MAEQFDGVDFQSIKQDAYSHWEDFDPEAECVVHDAVSRDGAGGGAGGDGRDEGADDEEHNEEPPSPPIASDPKCCHLVVSIEIQYSGYSK